MKRKSILNCRVIVIISILSAFVSVQAKPLPGTANLVPPETILLVEVNNFSQLKTQFEKTSLYKLYKDPAIATFVDDFKAKCRKKINEIDSDITRAVVDANILPQGRVAFALEGAKQ